MNESQLNNHDLPKFVIGGVNKITGTIGLIKTYDRTEEGEILPDSWRVALWDTLEEATAQFDKDKQWMSDWLRPVHLDELHREYARYLAETGQLEVEGIGKPSEELYRLANHIDGAKGGMPDGWQDWATEVVQNLRELSTSMRQAEQSQTVDTLAVVEQSTDEEAQQ